MIVVKAQSEAADVIALKCFMEELFCFLPHFPDVKDRMAVFDLEHHVVDGFSDAGAVPRWVEFHGNGLQKGL